MNRINRWTLAIAATTLTFAGCRKAETLEKPLTPVKTNTVELLTISDELRYSANIEPDRQVTAAFRLGGYVERLCQARGVDGRERNVQDGDFVRRGTILAELRQNDYTAKVNQVQAQLAEARSSLEAGKSQLAEAESAQQQAQTEFGRVQNLFASQSLTKADYDAAKTKLEVSRARVETAKGQVAAIRSRIDGIEALLTEARLALSDSSLKAPMDGVVLKRHIETGALVGPGTAAFTLADTSRVKVVFGVSDTLVSGLRLGMSLPVRTEALPGAEFSGLLTRVSPAADPRSRVFEVEVTVRNADGKLKTGMIASVELKGTGGVRKTPVLPLAAIVRSRSNPDGFAVFVVEEEGGRQVARLRDVQLGEAFGNAVALKGGVELGRRVITNGSNLVSDGEQVQVIP